MKSKPRCISNTRLRLLLVMFFGASLLASAYPAHSAPVLPLARDGIAANPGDLDPTFGNGGIVTTSIGSGNSFGYALVLQPDGKIVVAGQANNGSDDDFALLRYTTDGNLDSTFGNNGVVTTSIGSGDNYAENVALQPDGKIVVTGKAHNGSDLDFALARYTVSGELDTSFGSGGVVITPVGSNDDYAQSVALQLDGKIVVVGAADNGSDKDFALVRYTLSGELDTSFGSGGIVTTPIGPEHDWANSVILQPDSKIVVAGRTNNGSDEDIALLRYTTSGDLDSTFGSGGVVTTPIGTSRDIAHSVTLQPNGKILVVGETRTSDQSDFALVRYTTFGDLDPIFGSGDGIVTTFISLGDDRAYHVALQPDGKIVVAGEAHNGNDWDFALVRYTLLGELDTSFSSGGIVTTFISPESDRITEIVIQPDGKILAAGYAHNGSDWDFALARYQAYQTYPIYLPHVAR